MKSFLGPFFRHEIISRAILSLALIQVGQSSVGLGFSTIFVSIQNDRYLIYHLIFSLILTLIWQW